ncbi:MAG: MoaD/ThiS family protein [Desulfovibrionales bacterium]|nr:MoaD/ThiS family protein [Desulfovibrionales bacterium]
MKPDDPEPIRVEIFSTLRRFARGGETRFALPWKEEMVAQDVLDYLSIPDTAERVILINRRHGNENTPLAPGDLVILFPPLTGG